ncbi:hypothetical protein N752_05595 [Desulforamulus aquiferis]|nr:hypothetical protein N752_05595 [Desulforamulus aquiferis]
MEVSRHLASLAAKNKGMEDNICFLGAGSYDHYIPSAIKHILSRAEFYTATHPTSRKSAREYYSQSLNIRA